MAAPAPSAPPARPAPRVVPSALGLLEAARNELAASSRAVTPGDRYAAAHLAALRAAAAVLAARARPETKPRKGPRSAWVLLSEVAPALGEWAAFFAAGARKRAAAEAGLPRAVTTREADDLLRDAETFLLTVEESLGLRETF